MKDCYFVGCNFILPPKTKPLRNAEGFCFKYLKLKALGARFTTQKQTA
ncbi:hypothetical protein IAD21_04367 [Abditibacteriota bacterium]|nr:hypothetical protein IAD21_04367 [Abditibacteriota bacterium]